MEPYLTYGPVDRNGVPIPGEPTEWLSCQCIDVDHDKEPEAYPDGMGEEIARILSAMGRDLRKAVSSRSPSAAAPVIAGSAAVVTAIPTLGLKAATPEVTFEGQVRAFCDSMLTETPSMLTAGEWVSGSEWFLKALLGDPEEAWLLWETEIVQERERRAWKLPLRRV